MGDLVLLSEWDQDRWLRRWTDDYHRHEWPAPVAIFRVDERPQMTREQFFATLGLELGTATVALLPGSREKEVRHILPTMLEAAHRLSLTHKVQFVIAVAPTLDIEWMQRFVVESSTGKATVRPASHATYDALQHCEVAMVASGTATIEAALLERAMVVVYRVSGLTWRLGRLLVHVPFYSMVNILAGKQVVPELIQSDFTAGNVASRVEYLLDHPQAREEMTKEFRALKCHLGPGGAIERAAAAVAGVLQFGGTEEGVRSQKSGVRTTTPPAA